ncbi:MAG: TIR domain-containing protein [Clostridia bacterium]|nr:TIR domain-containing protein [Clostridia bacterium]
MAVIKCKMCGGDLLLTEGSTVAECEYCGSVQTVPTADNEKKLTLFARANRLRAANEFDKAAGVYESIVADFPEEAEAYWGLVLCKFGIEYVDDPATGKKVPTCHRSGFDSVMKDSDFEQACENADPTARRVYREEAKQIEEIRKRIIEVSGKEEPYDIFICYKETDAGGKRTVDSVIAQNVYDKLTESGYRVFFSRITLEDKLGLEYEPYIFAALNSAKVMLVFGTDYEHFNAVWFKNEWSRFLKLMAADKTKYLIPCYKDIDAYDMPEEFAHLQAQDMGKVGAEQDLIRGIKKLLPKEEPKKEPVQQPVVQQVIQQGGGPTVDSLLKRAFIFLGDGDFGQAEAYFNKALDIDPENSEANIGLMLKDAKVSTKKDFERAFIGGRVRPGSVYHRAKRFGGKQYADWFAQMEQARRQAEKQKLREEEKLAEQKRLEEERKRREAEKLAEQKRLEEERKHKETINRLKQARERIMPAQKLISAGSHHTVGLRTDGTVVATKYTGDKEFNKNYRQCEISGWKDIIDISTGCYHTVGLRANGTVVAV